MKTRLTNFLLLILLIMTSLFVEAEIKTGTVKGRVLDTQKQPVGFSTVALLNPQTRNIEKGTVCNEKGEFILEKVVKGEYFLSVRMMGFETNEKERLMIDGKTIELEKVIVLTASNTAIDEVVVAAKAEFVEQSVDKMVINPNVSLTTASENVYEILKKVPGVLIDHDDNISLKGKQGIVIMIDDKPTNVSAKDLAGMLKGMLGKDVKNIEIIENPSARFDAEGNAGIINIKTNHNRAPGFNGSVFSGLTFTKTMGENAGLNLNLNQGKFNFYGDYSFYDWSGWYNMEAKRLFMSDKMSGASQMTKNDNTSNGNAHNYKVGADYFLAKNHVISLMVKENTGFNNSEDDGTTSFRNRISSVDSSLVNLAQRENTWNRITYNVNYKWDIDSLGTFLTADVDYAHFIFESNNNQQSLSFDAAGNDINKNINLLSNQNSAIDIVTGRVDYTHPINAIYSYEAGLKTSFVKTNSLANMVGYKNQDDNFVYHENIQAAYASGKAQFEKTTIQVGLRMENTQSKGNSVSTNQIDKKNYLKFFPSVFVQQKLTADQNMGIRYSYRIGRPNYHSLNPFIWMIDPYTYNQGNPLLNPQFTHSVSLNHNYKSLFMTSLGYNYTNDLITEVIYQNDETKAIYQTNENFGTAIDLNLSETVQFEIQKWWRFNCTATGIYKEVNSNLPSGKQFNQWSYMINAGNNITLPYKIALELNGRYMSEQLHGNFTIKSSYNIDLGVQKTVLNEKGVIKASLSDIFNTGSGGAYTKYENVDVDVKNKFETRRLNISFSYRFGKNEFKTRANRSTSSSEEESRSGK